MAEEQSMAVPLSTVALESKLRTLRDKSNNLSQTLTQKLASSQSGQNLLHIGSSLSTLPPDLHSLLAQLHPLVVEVESFERANLSELSRVVSSGNEIRSAQRKVDEANECSELYKDLLSAERDLKRDVEWRRGAKPAKNEKEEDSLDEIDELDHIVSLERAAHTTLVLVQELSACYAQVSALKEPAEETLPSMRVPLPDDTEKAQFLMKLAPRIRRLEGDAVSCLTSRLERVLGDIQEHHGQESDNLLMVGHCMRGLALLGRGKEAESAFARVAIMPLIRSKVSMGRLDEGGSRGSCAGLFSLLDGIATSICTTFGKVIRLSEAMFEADVMEVDLVTAGVWVPIATALMADPATKMAIFSPGIASILQANYVALDTFLSELATRLLKEETPENGGISSAECEYARYYFNPTITEETIAKAQTRIYRDPMTADFSKKWNLPIYYQLRIGACCNRLNSAIESVRKEGWQADVFTGDDSMGDTLRRKPELSLPFFLELYDIILGLWRPDVILRPLTHRFLRGGIQLVGRMVGFINDGLSGKIKFGEDPPPPTDSAENGVNGNVTAESSFAKTAAEKYCWGDNLEDVACVAWDLTVLESKLSRDYLDTAIDAVKEGQSESEVAELRSIARELLEESLQEVEPIILNCWNDVIVGILTKACSDPLLAVKGVAATYRMTNRPPPTQASPFVPTILRPLKEFDAKFAMRTPAKVGISWKMAVVSTVSERYSAAVEDLLATVKRTEVALKNRKARRMAAGGMSDGEKVKLQLYLDHMEFTRNVTELGLDTSAMAGLSKLRAVTVEAELLYKQQQNGS